MLRPNLRPFAVLGQVIAYGVFVTFLGYFSVAPSYRHLAPELALIKLSFSHAGARKVACRRRTPEELAVLAPNMRRQMACPRERIDLLVELVVDEQLFYRGALPPSGLARDGASTVYQRFPIAAGPHRVTVRLRDSVRDDGFDHAYSEEVELSAAQNFVIDFDTARGGFVFLQ